MLGSQVVDRLIARGKRVRALVRPTSQTEKLVAAGVELAPGDLLAPETLLRALDGVDAVVTSAAGYTRHSEGDTIETDRTGNLNLVGPAAAVGVRRLALPRLLHC